MVQEIATWFELHEKIQIAVWHSLTSCRGAEDSHVPRAVATGDAKDVFTLSL